MSPKLVRLKLYLDENFPVPAGMFLKENRHSVKFTEKFSKGKPDIYQVKAATKQKRILVSLDKDFKINESLTGVINKSFGVILIVCSQTDSENIIRILKKQMNFLNPKLIKGKVCRVSFDKIDFTKIKE